MTPWRYALPALPLAFVGLPLYVHLPHFYAAQGASLAALGTLLLALRLVDGIQDPLIGRLLARRAPPQVLLGAVGVLAVGMPALFAPPAGWSLVWLGVSLLVTMTAFSILQVVYTALPADHATDRFAHARLAGWREAFGIIGIAGAVTLPDVLPVDRPLLVAMLGGGVLVLVLTPPLLLRHPPRPRPHAVAPWRGLWASRPVRLLLCYQFLSAFAIAWPAALFLFVMEAVVNRPAHAGFVLLAYFGAAALCMPAWLAVARQSGTYRTLVAATCVAVGAFCMALTLGEGDLAMFTAIAVITGGCFGADAALPPALLTRLLRGDGQSPAAGFGIWTFIAKAVLALATGVSLWVLDLTGYDASLDTQPARATGALLVMYAGIPCLLKLGALGVLTMLHRRHPDATD